MPLSVQFEAPRLIGNVRDPSLVDDDGGREPSRKMAARCAHVVRSRRAYSYAGRVAHDGPSALAVADGFRSQLALLDLGPPIMDGSSLREISKLGLS